MGEENLKNLDYFRFKIEKGWAKKNIPNTKEYRDRLEYEIQVISKLGFIDYMLMIALGLLLWLFLRTKYVLERWEGTILLLIYIFYIAKLIVF